MGSQGCPGRFTNALGIYLPQARVHTRVLFLEGSAKFKSPKDTTGTVSLSLSHTSQVFMGQSQDGIGSGALKHYQQPRE